MYAYFPYVLQYNSVKETNEVRGIQILDTLTHESCKISSKTFLYVWCVTLYFTFTLKVSSLIPSYSSYMCQPCSHDCRNVNEYEKDIRHTNGPFTYSISLSHSLHLFLSLSLSHTHTYTHTVHPLALLHFSLSSPPYFSFLLLFLQALGSFISQFDYPSI